MKPTHVIADGPYAAQDHEGEEYPEWTVSLNNDDGDEWDVSRHRSREEAIRAGDALAKKHRIEFVCEAGQA